MTFLRKILLPTLLLVTLSCSPNKSANDKSKDGSKSSKKSEESTLSVSKIIITPPPPQIGGDKIISFAVTDQIPLKDVLIELGRVAQIDVDLDSSISGGIVLNAKNRPLKEVIDRIAKLGNLRYSYQNGVLHFEKDMPYSKNYFVDFLTGSQLWSDVESNITAILNVGSNQQNQSGQDQNANGGNNNQNTAHLNSNKSAGIISIYANNSQHEQISKYLDDVYKNSSAQVLIEAKVVEVTLSREFDTGINWSWVDTGKTASTSGTFGSGNAATSSFDISIPKISTITGIGGDLSAKVQILEQFGKAKAISSPRINAINNQKAVLDFSQKKIYFTVSASSSVSTGTATNTVSTVTATKNEVDVGVRLEITPSINLATNEITLDVKPKLSIDTGQVAKDPSVNPNGGASLGNTIPIINTRQLSTIAKVQSGSILVIGGLISENSNEGGSGIPILMRIPLLKYFFGFFYDSSNKVETVIFIKATILNSSNNMNKYDRDFYKKNSNDPTLNSHKKSLWEKYTDY